jgi:hypothetical protein
MMTGVLRRGLVGLLNGVTIGLNFLVYLFR